MVSFGPLERAVARSLDRVPHIKRLIKRAYQLGNYAVFAERGFCLFIDERCSIASIGDGGTALSESTFFGYYDKSPWDRRMARFAWHKANPDGSLSIMVRLADKQATEIARTYAWSWQQGAMTQWVGDVLVFNTVHDNKLSSVWYPGGNDVPQVISWPVQAVAPSGDYFVSLNYRRLQVLRPDYGYAVEVGNFQSRMKDDQDGLWGVERNSGEACLLVSLKQLRELTPAAECAVEHKVNHVMFSPSGERFVFVYRWFGSEGKKSRLFLYDRPTTSLKLLLDGGMVSHYCWRNEKELIVYCRTDSGDGYYQVNPDSGAVTPFASGQLDHYGDGHPSVSPCGCFLITDTYPDRKRQQRLLLYSFADDKIAEVGRFLLPLRFDGEQRIDLHPRWSPSGNMISIDSGHEGRRATYILDIRQLLAAQ